MFRRALLAAVTIVGLVIIALVAASPASSATSPSTATASPEKSITYSHVVDLSHVISPSIPLWPGDPRSSSRSSPR